MQSLDASDYRHAEAVVRLGECRPRRIEPELAAEQPPSGRAGHVDIPGFGDRESGTRQRRGELGAVVAANMSNAIIEVAVEGAECWREDEYLAAWSKPIANFAQGTEIVVDVFQDVYQHHGVEENAWLEILDARQSYID